jgi:hypothetical protein
MSKLTAPPYALMRLRDGLQYGRPIDTNYTVTAQTRKKITVPGYPFALGYDTAAAPALDSLNLDLSAEIVPGYDIGLLHTFGQVNVGGQAVWDVLIPDAPAEYDQNQHFLVCNGPQPILPGKYGFCTQDWPARVLHYDTSNGAPELIYTNDMRLGPKAGSWCAWNRGFLDDSCFQLISHDATYPEADPQGQQKIHVEPKPNPHTLWIRGSNAYYIEYESGTGGSPHDAGAIIPVTGAPFTSPTGTTNAHVNGMTLSGGGFMAATAGPHLFGFQATLSSETAPAGAKLGLKLYIDTTATSWEAYRLQDIEQDTNYQASPLLYTGENVACSGLVYLTAGQTIYVKNASQYTMEVGGLSFWAARMGAV